MQRTIIRYSIDPNNTYNSDETGFAMGLTVTAKGITWDKYHNERLLLQPGNRKQVTAMQCTNAWGGRCLRVEKS